MGVKHWRGVMLTVKQARNLALPPQWFQEPYLVGNEPITAHESDWEASAATAIVWHLSGCSAVGSAHALGAWGRKFESSHPDHAFPCFWPRGSEKTRRKDGYRT